MEKQQHDLALQEQQDEAQSQPTREESQAMWQAVLTIGIASLIGLIGGLIYWFTGAWYIVVPLVMASELALTAQQPQKIWQTITTIGIALLIVLIGGLVYWFSGAWYIVVPLVVASELVCMGYRMREWTWTGIGEYVPPDGTDQGFQRAKTLWDWLQLAGVIAIPIVVVLIPGWLSMLNTQNLQLAQIQHRNDLQIAQDQQRQTTLEWYLHEMSDLILNKSLNDPKGGVETRALARAQTVTALLILDPGRKAILIQFLYHAHLIDTSRPIIDLSGADLRNLTLNRVNLEGVDLSGADLRGAGLNQALLANADLSNTLLAGASLSDADLSGVDLLDAKVTKEQLAKAQSLKNAILPDGSKHP